MDMTNAKWIGNWQRINLNDNLVSDGMILIQGIKTLFSRYEPVRISASIIYLLNSLTISLILLQNPSVRLRFRNSIIGTPFFNINL